VAIKRFFYSLRAYLTVINKDLRGGFPLSFIRKLECWKGGFLAEKYVLYGLAGHSKDFYLSDVHASMARWVNEPYTSVLSNKFLFEKVVGPVIRTPKTLGLIINGHLIASEVGEGDGDWGALIDLCRTEPVILKPVVGGGGKGVMQVLADGAGLSINGESLSHDRAISRLSDLDDYLVSEFVAQGEFARSLNPATTNTLRVVTLYDDDMGEPFIARAVQRIGNNKSAPYDNFTQGGLSAMIDLQTGMLGKAASHPESPTLQWHSIHPDTDGQIEGRVVPGWHGIQESIVNAARQVPFLKCVGWDFMLTDDGLCAIEGNHHPDPDVLQCHGGLLHDDRVRRFYARHGVVRPA
jgi:hypothetical protein